MRSRVVACCAALVIALTVAAPVASKPEPPTPLPNLFMYPPSFLIGPVDGQLPYRDPTSPDAPVEDGCFAEERAAGAKRCLRFMSKLFDFDVAPLRLVLRTEPSGTNVYQEIDGRYRPAGTFSFDPVRGEVQVDDFYELRLWRFDGRRKVGPPVAATGPRGLCPGIPRYVRSRPTCATPTTRGGGGLLIELPWLFPAWYPPDEPGQYLEISGVPDGQYVFEIEIDPKDRIRESYERDNTTCVVIRLRGTEVDELRHDYCWPRRT